MKAAFSLLMVVFVSCKTPTSPEEVDYTGFVQKEISLVGFDKEINLADSLAAVSIMIPERLDTFYKWHRTSDCLSCGWLQYRFSDKKYTQFAEGGFYWTMVPDSVYQITIRHKPIKEIPDTIIFRPLTQKDTGRWYYHPQIVSAPTPPNFLLREFRLIRGRPFIISGFISPYGYLTRSETLFVIAETNLRSRELYFIGECGAKDTTGFIDNMYKSFLSIRIEEK